MAKVTEVSVSVAYKKSLPNYENITFHAGIKLAVEEGDSVDKVYKNAWDRVGEELESQLKLFEDEQKSGVKKGLK